jgi:hypothetical protein
VGGIRDEEVVEGERSFPFPAKWTVSVPGRTAWKAFPKGPHKIIWARPLLIKPLGGFWGLFWGIPRLQGVP